MYIMHTLLVCMYIYPKLQYKRAYSCSINVVDAYRYHAIGQLLEITAPTNGVIGLDTASILERACKM